MEVATCTSAFGVHYALRYTLTVEVCELFDQVHILQQPGSAFADS